MIKSKDQIIILECIVPLTLIYSGWLSLGCQILKKKGTKRNIFWLSVSVCLCWGAAPHLSAFFGVCLTTKHKPFCQTNWSCVRERGRPRPKLQRWALFDSCFHLFIIPPSHSRIFGLPKVFLSLSPSSPTLSLFLSLGCDWLLWQSRHWAVSLF